MKKLSYLFIALFISACQAEPDFTEEVTPLLHTRAGSLQFAQTDNLNLDALGIVHPTKIVRKDSLYVILTPQSAYRFAIYNHLNGTLHHLVPAGSGEGEGHCYLNLHLNGNIVSALDSAPAVWLKSISTIAPKQITALCSPPSRPTVKRR